MNIKKAWLALWGKLEPIEKVIKEKGVEKEYVYVGDSVIEVFLAESRRWKASINSGYGMVPAWPQPEWHGKYFHSCADAFAAGGGDAEVKQYQAIVTDGKALLLTYAKPIELRPKPKVSKGKRNSDGRS